MTNYLFIKLSEKVRNCDPKQIKDYGFEYDSLTEGLTSAWFTIHTMPTDDDYYVVIENNKVYFAHGDNKLFKIVNEDAENWKSLANDLFQDYYTEEIEEAKKDGAYISWMDYQDARGEMSRHEW